MTAIHHTGLVVSDLDRSIAFYEDHFGAELELRTRASGADVATLHGLEGEADFTIAMLRLGDGRLELFEFHAPTDGQELAVRACDIASFHVAITVEDIRARYRQLSELGVEFTREPLSLGEGDLGDFAVAFCADPDGNRIELVQLP